MIGLRCDKCGRVLEPAETVYQEITGWAKVRDQGGANAVALRQLTGRIACHPCIDRAARGREGQTELLAANAADTHEGGAAAGRSMTDEQEAV